MSPAGARTRKVAESDLEDLALLHFTQLGYECIHGPDIAPDEPAAERADFENAPRADRLRLMPALTVSEGEIDQMLALTRQAIETVRSRM